MVKIYTCIVLPKFVTLRYKVNFAGETGVISDDQLRDCFLFSSWFQDDYISNSSGSQVFSQFP